jgi:nitrogen regulatory protein PII
MKRVTIILKTSEVVSVHKAVCMAGADSVVYHPNPRKESVWFSNLHAPAEDGLIRLEVMVFDRLSDKVVSAILATARLGKIEKISNVKKMQEVPDACMLAA